MTTATAAGELDFYHEQTKFKGLFGWIFSTDHKRIGILYLVSIMSFFLVGMAIGVLMRLEMLNPENTIVTAQTYNTFFTLHGIIMIFLVVIPAFPAVFGNFFLPLMIGAKDVFFPRLNLLSWWLFIAGGTLALVSIFLPGGAADTGWTFYVPYSIRSNTNIIPRS
jgi:cytochrome c oxidase subunit 1